MHQPCAQPINCRQDQGPYPLGTKVRGRERYYIKGVFEGVDGIVQWCINAWEELCKDKEVT